MKTVVVGSWGEFEEELKAIRNSEIPTICHDDVLYRGLPDSEWQLETTLERAGKKGCAFLKYFELMLRVQPHIESFTSRKWLLEKHPDVQALLRNYNSISWRHFPDPETYSYMLYLRHHGFPSPLLDWSQSPYVAAYFAFRSQVRPVSGNVSIYMYSERPSGGKSTSSNEPQIQRQGRFVTTHKRHFLQRSDYTLCLLFSDQWEFIPHHNVFSASSPRQDLLWKFDIQWSERLTALKVLDSYNLNAQSLFESDDAMMETLALRELYFRAKNEDTK